MFQHYALNGILIDGFSNVLNWITLAVLLFEVFAFVDVLFRRSDAFPAVDKQTKPFWMIILGLAVAVSLVPLGSFLGSMLILLGLVAAIVYVVDVRPRVRAITPSRRNKKDNTHQGPYGPW
jgi:Protein of unknown function (DUF2516)